jgi:hypothetical protein
MEGELEEAKRKLQWSEIQNKAKDILLRQQKINKQAKAATGAIENVIEVAALGPYDLKGDQNARLVNEDEEGSAIMIKYEHDDKKDKHEFVLHRKNLNRYKFLAEKSADEFKDYGFSIPHGKGRFTVFMTTPFDPRGCDVEVSLAGITQNYKLKDEDITRGDRASYCVKLDFDSPNYKLAFTRNNAHELTVKLINSFTTERVPLNIARAPVYYANCDLAPHLYARNFKINTLEEAVQGTSKHTMGFEIDTITDRAFITLPFQKTEDAYVEVHIPALNYRQVFKKVRDSGQVDKEGRMVSQTTQIGNIPLHLPEEFESGRYKVIISASPYMKAWSSVEREISLCRNKKGEVVAFDPYSHDHIRKYIKQCPDVGFAKMTPVEKTNAPETVYLQDLWKGKRDMLQFQFGDSKHTVYAEKTGFGLCELVFDEKVKVEVGSLADVDRKKEIQLGDNRYVVEYFDDRGLDSYADTGAFDPEQGIKNAAGVHDWKAEAKKKGGITSVMKTFVPTIRIRRAESSKSSPSSPTNEIKPKKTIYDSMHQG